MVKNVKNGNSVIFNNISANNAGEFPLTIQYYSTSSVDIDVSVNQGSSQTFTLPATGQWCYQQGTPGTAEVTIPLAQGSNNSIEISNINVIDNITVH